MWKTSFLGWALASMLILTGSASADTFAFTSAGSVTWNGVYVNPYQANDTTQTQHNPLTIYCDDWNTDFSGNPTWNATVYSLTAVNEPNFKYAKPASDYNVTLAGNQLSVALSTTPTPFNRYLEAAWLDEQWLDAVTQGTATDQMQIKLAAAVWTLFVDPTHVGGLIDTINSSGYAAAVNDYLVAAKDQVDNHGYTAAGWDVIVPVGNNSNGGPMQEFLVDAPEPSAVILLGTVVGVLGLTKFRRKRRA